MTRQAVVAVPLVQLAAGEAAALQFDPSTRGSTFTIPLYDSSGAQTLWACSWVIPDADWQRLTATFAAIPGATVTEAAIPTGLATSASAANQSTIQQQIQTAMAQLQTYINAPPITVGSLAQAQAAVTALQGAVQFEAQVLRRLIRYMMSQFDGSN